MVFFSRFRSLSGTIRSTSKRLLATMPSIDTSFKVNHTCLRVKDPKVSVPFYEKNFGLKLVEKIAIPGGNTTLYLLGLENESNKDLPWTAREGLLELCHDHGSETNDSFTVNHGNGKEFRGFGHICFSVDNIQASESDLLAAGVKFQKKLSDGRQKDIAFALDPDGYWIELIEHTNGKVEGKTNTATYKFNHTMIRVKDPVKSLNFYQNVLGLKLLNKLDFPEAQFTLYFLGYEHDANFSGYEGRGQAAREGIIELTHNYGTEDDASFSYHNGNSTENGAIAGFGHTCVTCKDPKKFVDEINALYKDADWSVKFDEAPVKSIAFLRDPDGYSVEIFGWDTYKNLK